MGENGATDMKEAKVREAYLSKKNQFQLAT